MADPDRTADLGERDRCHLVVELGRHRRDEDTDEAMLDIHLLTLSRHVVPLRTS